MRFLPVTILVLLFGLFISKASVAEQSRFSIGLGAGALYNGLGIAFGLQNAESFKYISTGCLSISTSDTFGNEFNCGIGIGYLNSTIISNENNKHGLGIHIGVTYNQIDGLNKAEAFIAPQYIYFFDGIDDKGYNLGASILYGTRNGKTDLGLGLQIGYQF